LTRLQEPTGPEVPDRGEDTSCCTQVCPDSSVRVLRYKRDVSGIVVMRFERKGMQISNLDILVAPFWDYTKVINYQNQRYLGRYIEKQIPCFYIRYITAGEDASSQRSSVFKDSHPTRIDALFWERFVEPAALLQHRIPIPQRENISGVLEVY
jgi:hypothetical protein